MYWWLWRGGLYVKIKYNLNWRGIKKFIIKYKCIQWKLFSIGKALLKS